ncbi:MAG: adenosine kinase, partial [Bacteroidales bacterium]|nr:adenosine kinase [Bacteroidales bacterium]
LFRRDTATGTAITLISPDAQRTFATHLGAAVEMRAKDLSQETFEGYQIFYLEGYLITNYDLVDTACRMATRENMTIAVDLSSYNVVEENRDSFEKIIRSYADIVFANEDEARAFSGMPPAEALDYLSALCEIAVVKTGANGSILKKAGEIVQVDAVPVICNDTTGAGDLYASGFLYGFARGASLEQCGKYGSALAARVIEIPGARMDRERFLQIRNLIN